MKTLSLLLLVAGLLLAPAYWIYSKFYTGEQAALLALGRIDGGGWRSPVFRVDADMAPLGLILSTQGSFAPNMHESDPPADRYVATLYRDGAAAQPLTFTLSAKNISESNPVFKEHLVLMNKVTAGEYHLEVMPMTEPRIHHDRMLLEVRRNLSEPDNRVVITGIVLLVLGILGLVAL